MNDDLTPINGKLLLTVEEVAGYLAIGRSHVYKHVMDGSLRSVLIGRSRRIPVYALNEFVKHLDPEEPNE